jgi:hypothetical protein
VSVEKIKRLRQLVKEVARGAYKEQPLHIPPDYEHDADLVISWAADSNEKTVFITSASFNSNLGGLTGADDKCQAEADSPTSIVPSGTYMAWLSDGTDSPNTRFTS